MGRIGSVNTEDFENGIKNGIALVDFSAPWCVPCLAQKPIIDELAKRFRGRAAFVEVNVDENRQSAMKLRIMSIPTIIIFKEGQEMQRFVGLQPEDRLSEAIEKALK